MPAFSGRNRGVLSSWFPAATAELRLQISAGKALSRDPLGKDLPIRVVEAVERRDQIKGAFLLLCPHRTPRCEDEVPQMDFRGRPACGHFVQILRVKALRVVVLEFRSQEGK
jgi:hypothetical protein